MSNTNTVNKKTVVLFSTRFLEQEDKLFCDANSVPFVCKSSKYLKFFLDKKTDNLIRYFNKLHYHDFFGKYKDGNGNPFIIGNENGKEIGEKLWGKIPEVKYEQRRKWNEFFSDLDKMDYLFEIVINSEAKFTFFRTESDEQRLFIEIIKHEGSVLNKDISLNTDFGGSADKKTIDRRFKIYKLRQGGLNDIQAFGVWCLSEKSKDLEWYEALYEELKIQMTNDKENKTQEGIDFGSVGDILFFLHDGDIGEQKPFAVKHYKERKDKFNFLDDGKSLSVAIFQHSLSSIATVLSTPKIDEAIHAALNEMEKGGKLAFLNELSDYVAYWHDGGKENYIKDVENGKLKFEIDSLIPKEDVESNSKSVKDVFCEAKRLIDELTQ